MKKILFFGDSITDSCRDYNFDWSLGMGYVTLVCAELGVQYPDTYAFYNRGISGNRAIDLYARVRSELMKIQPDYMSILVGVNDVWHELNKQYNGFSAKRFQDIYAMMIEDILETCPNIKLFLIEPYVMKHPAATEADWDFFRTEVDKRIEAVRALGKQYNLPVASLQDKFDELLKTTSVDNWTGDGVHPTSAGSRVIAKEWLSTFLGL